MPEQLWITALLNKYLAGVANAILGAFHLHSATSPGAHHELRGHAAAGVRAAGLVLRDCSCAAFGGRSGRAAARNGEHQFVCHQPEPRSDRPRLRAIHWISDRPGHVHPGLLPHRCDSRLRGADSDSVGSAGLRAGHLVLLSLPRHSAERLRLYQEFPGP